MLANEGTYFVYTVKINDTVFGIATMLRSTVDEIEQLNSLYPPFTDPELLYEGRQLIVPYSFTPQAQVLYFVQPGETLPSIAGSFGLDLQAVEALNPQLSDINKIVANQLLELPVQIEIVEEGDSLWRIAERRDLPVSALLHANANRHSFSGDVIYPGYALLLPRCLHKKMENPIGVKRKRQN
ncbi:LysM peptidoglycan-binding domain-containing protein [Alkalihalobacillus oceani]|uniref:LysM peptidoglycan-binding domain-containing protein n=1 Tax=Halalkalibacter oceani TaxID=1653776 RepID=A0A9X2DR76_9BACI|nr:LysM peptidoglycan-binding domain-containing protein [Halalkalibacter oceani]